MPRQVEISGNFNPIKRNFAGDLLSQLPETLDALFITRFNLLAQTVLPDRIPVNLAEQISVVQNRFVCAG